MNKKTKQAEAYVNSFQYVHENEEGTSGYIMANGIVLRARWANACFTKEQDLERVTEWLLNNMKGRLDRYALLTEAELDEKYGPTQK